MKRFEEKELFWSVVVCCVLVVVIGICNDLTFSDVAFVMTSTITVGAVMRDMFNSLLDEDDEDEDDYED